MRARQQGIVRCGIILAVGCLWLHGQSTFTGFAPQTQRQKLVLRAAPVKAADGMRVRMDMQAKLADGTVFESTEGSEPLSFIIGEEETLQQLEETALGLAVGETKEVTYGEDQPVFGAWTEDRMIEVPLEKVPKGTKAGDQLTFQEGMPPVKVAELQGDNCIIDANHPFAGKAITFTVTLLDVEEVAESERLQVEILQAGDGKTFPEPGDKLTMHYTGTLAKNGAKFDSSRDRGQPFQFQIGVGQVIQGWDKGVMKMSLGERAVLKIPSALGYGARGAGSDIPPNADLVFDVELLAIN